MLVCRLVQIFNTVITSIAITSYPTISLQQNITDCEMILLLRPFSKWSCCCSMQNKASLELLFSVSWTVLHVFWSLLWLCKLVTACIRLTCTTIKKSVLILTPKSSLLYKKVFFTVGFNPTSLYILKRQRSAVLHLHNNPTLTLKSLMLDSMLAQNFQCWLQCPIYQT